MSKASFAQLTGLFLVIGGAFGAVAGFSQLQPGDHYTYYGVYQVLLWLIAPSFFFIGLGHIGLGIRYAEALGKAGEWAAYGMGLASLGMTIAMVGTQFQGSLWNIWYVLGLVHVACLILFGVLHLRNRALAVFPPLPLMIAAGWLFMNFNVAGRFPETYRNLLLFLMVSGIGLGWLAIGLVIQRQRSAAALSVA
jgi:hypothetical protein